MSDNPKEVIDKIKEIDLLTYLENYEPYELVKINERMYSTREHDSLKISNGLWCWWSRGIGGKNALAHIYNRKSLPQIDTLNSLCKGFNITLEQFFTEDEKYKQLSDEEKEVLKLWNALDSDNKNLAKDLMTKLNLK